MKEIKISSKKYLGQVALVDDEDYEFLSQWKWFVKKRKYTFYAFTNSSRKNGQKGRFISMHRFILKLNDPKIEIDHEDRNGLNNQKSNLRPSTKSQNLSNSISHQNSSSKYLGVSWSKTKKKWVAQLNKNGKKIFIGAFINEDDAFDAYKKKAIEIHGEFASHYLKLKNAI